MNLVVLFIASATKCSVCDSVKKDNIVEMVDLTKVILKERP